MRPGNLLKVEYRGDQRKERGRWSYPRRREPSKKQLTAAVAARRAVAALDDECRDLLARDEALGDGLIRQLLAEKRALRKQWAALSLRNYVRLRQAPLNPRRKRLMRMRYVQGQTWAAITAAFGLSRQYLMREHNRSLEILANQKERAA